ATKGADAQVAVNCTREGNTRFALNEISTSGDVERQQIALTVQLGQRSSSAVTNQPDERSLAELVDRTLRMARLAPETPERLPPLGRQSYLPDKGAVDPATAKLTPDVRAKAVGAAIAAADAAKLTIAGLVRHAGHSLALGTTAGLSAYHA